jgi:hypothetical protein
LETVFEFIQVFGIFGNCKRSALLQALAVGSRLKSGSIDAVLRSAAAADTTRFRVDLGIVCAARFFAAAHNAMEDRWFSSGQTGHRP